MKIFEIIKELTEIGVSETILKMDLVKGRHKRLLQSISKEATLNKVILKTNWSKSYYYEVAKELKDKLFDLVLFAEFPKSSTIRRAWIRCHRLYAVYKILTGLQSHQLANHIGKQLLKEAIEFEFTHIVSDVSRNMMQYYGGIGFDKKLFFKYQNLSQKYFDIGMYEFKAQQIYHEITLSSVHKKEYETTLLPKIKSKLAELDMIAPKTSSSNFFIHYYFLQVLEKELLSDNQAMILTCNNALTFFQSKNKPIPAAANSIFLNKKLIALFHLNHLSEAKEIIEKVLNIENKKSTNYAIALQFKVLWAFHSNHLETAMSILLDIQNANPAKGYLRQVWLILEAFANFFIITGTIDSINNLRNFRLNKFLNEVPTLETDKSGFNATLIILQILFLLTKRDDGKDTIIERVESIRTYLRTHFKERKNNQRTKIFIKMLLVIPKSNFKRAVVAHNVKPLLRQLGKTPFRIGELQELEIVPYKRLWQMAFDLL